MRPIERGRSPQESDFEDYTDAFPELRMRLGAYCSYCERRIPTNLAVEHIQPKNLEQFKHLEGRWENFLLACVNCNSTKSDKNIVLGQFLLPDRDNTFGAFHYQQDGIVNPNAGFKDELLAYAWNTLKVCGLDKPVSEVTDSNGQLVRLDRVGQRMETWGIAQRSKSNLELNPTDPMKRQIVQTALSQGYFSIWMTVFADNKEMRQRFIDAFPGTAYSCFDKDTIPVSPRPVTNPQLPFSGKC